MLFIWIITLVLLILAIVEKKRHTSRLKKIPLRIHVNGTRGKSLLTRMITDLFQHTGYAVAAKVTGERPQYYTPHSGWTNWKRNAPPRIQEQIRFVNQVSAAVPGVMIVENMALAPENQYAAEYYMIQSHLTVFTNFRPDHQEIMGQTIADVRRTLALSLPQNGAILLPQQDYHDYFRDVPISQNSKIIPINSDSNLFDSHFAMLQKISELYNLPAESVDHTIQIWRNNLQLAHFIHELPSPYSSSKLINLFTCNDVTSATEIINHLQDSELIRPPYNIVLACRGDRPLRTMAFLKWILFSLEFNHLIVAGPVPWLPVQRLQNLFRQQTAKIIFKRKATPQFILSAFENSSPYILGLGNYFGTGEKIISFIEEST